MKPTITASLCLLLSFLSLTVNAQKKEVKDPEFLQYVNSPWVDSVMQRLTPDERIAQLIMVAAYSNRGEEHREEILKLIKEQKIGGLIFFQGGPVRQARLMNEYQAHSKVPLLGAIDAEWGLGMRLDSTISYPFQMSLGAVQNDSLIYRMGAAVARHIKRVGLHLNFAPVVDVNNNPANPVINFRSFGENKYKVAQKGIAYMQGMQDQGVLPTAKHFPGHGDTDVDSHYALPQIKHSLARLDSLELYPFRELIKAGVGGVMVAHLDIPALDSLRVPSTLSKAIISSLLKEKMEFRGLVVTDAMNMKGVTEGNEPGIVDKFAILAGNDLLEFTEDVPLAIAQIRQAVNEGLISQAEIDRRCRKLLALKQWAGLDNYSPVLMENLVKDLNTSRAKLLDLKLTEASLTVLRNERDLLPIKKLGKRKIAAVSIGADTTSRFQEFLGLYAPVSEFYLAADAGAEEVEELKAKLQKFNTFITGLHDVSRFPRNKLELSEPVRALIKEFAEKQSSVMAVFKNPYVLNDLEGVENAGALLLTYQDSKSAQEMAAQLIFGGVGASGTLPVSVGTKFREGEGLRTKGGIRFKYSLPEDAGLDSQLLQDKVDSLMQQAMQAKAIPGGQLLIARDQKVILHKAYGYHTYHDTIKVKTTDLYDLASITKISSALPALIQLYDEDKFSLDAGIDTYLPYFKGSDKAGIPFRKILAHQAGLQAWIPYWKSTLRKNGSYKWNTFKKDSSARFPIKVTEDMWLHRKYRNKIYRAIKRSPLETEEKYLYSGLAFYLLPEIVERISGEDFITYLDENFYAPLGAGTLTYKPLEKFGPDRITPTENDYLFRKMPIHGSVHDEGAIMMGGISANAGLFSNANDLAKLMQMYLNKGTYGGEQFISEESIKEFTAYQYREKGNRRGLGFDKPALGERTVSSNAAVDASEKSYGHTGFTGTMVWADPEYNLLYIFLSNRTIPDRQNTRLYLLNTRTLIQQAAYDAIKAFNN